MSHQLENFTRTLMLVIAMLLPTSHQAKVARHQMKSVVKHPTHTKMGILNPVLYFPVSRGPTSFKGLHQFLGVPPVSRSSTNAGMLYRTHSTMRNLTESGKHRWGTIKLLARLLSFLRWIITEQFCPQGMGHWVSR